jgi:hypothetical protein
MAVLPSFGIGVKEPRLSDFRDETGNGRHPGNIGR